MCPLLLYILCIFNSHIYTHLEEEEEEVERKKNFKSRKTSELLSYYSAKVARAYFIHLCKCSSRFGTFSSILAAFHISLDSFSYG